MYIYLFSITDDPRVVHKDIPSDALADETVDINATEIKDILNPSFTVDRASQISGKYNYAHIPDFERYYFITGLFTSPSGNVRLDMHVDVLKTYEDSIDNLEGMIIRSSKATGDLIDKSLPINEKKKSLHIYPVNQPIAKLKDGDANPDVLLFAT